MEKICVHCGKPFTSQRSTRLYCSDNCKQLAYYKRNGLILSGGKNGYDNSLACHATVQDVNYTSHNESIPDSFLTKLNAFIIEEVERRIAQRNVQTIPTEKVFATVKPSFTLNDNANNYPGTDGATREFVSDALQQDNLSVKKSASVKKTFTLKHKPDRITHVNAIERSKRDAPDSVTVNYHKIQSIPLSNEVENNTAPQVEELEVAAQILNDELLSDTHNSLEHNLDENDSVTSASNDNSEISENDKPNITGQFSWVYSSFTERINNHLVYSEADILGYIKKFGNNGVKVMETCKCLLKHVMLLSNRNEINHSSLITLSNAFYRLVQTKEFLSLPRDFPYCAKISELQKKIRSFAQTATDGDPVRLHLLAEQRAAFFAMLSEIGDRVRDVKIGEISFGKG